MPHCSCPSCSHAGLDLDRLAHVLARPLIRHIAGVPTSKEQRCIRCQRVIVSANESESQVAFRRGTEVVMMDDFVMGTAEFFADNCSYSSNEPDAALRTTPEETH